VRWERYNPLITIPGTSDNCRSALITGSGIEQDAFEVKFASMTTDDIIKNIP